MKFGVIGNYGVGNLGDQAILSGLTSFLKRTSGGAEVVVFGAGNLFPFGLRSFFRSLIKWDMWQKPWNQMKACDRVILGGGGLFSDEEMPFTAVFWTLQGAVALFLKKPLFCIGISVSQIGFFSRFILKMIFLRAKKVIVRDKDSKTLLNSCGIPAELGSDLALLNIYEIRQVQNDKKYVFVSIRDYPNLNNNLNTIFAQFIDFLDSKYSLKTILIPFSCEQQNDTALMNKIVDQLKEKSSCQILGYTQDLAKVFEVISGAEAGVGMRLHAGIFALICGVPFIPISYSTKVSGFWNGIGTPIEANCLTFEILTRSFEDMWQNRTLIKEELGKARKSLTSEVERRCAVILD